MCFVASTLLALLAWRNVALQPDCELPLSAAGASLVASSFAASLVDAEGFAGALFLPAQIPLL